MNPTNAAPTAASARWRHPGPSHPAPPSLAPSTPSGPGTRPPAGSTPVPVPGTASAPAQARGHARRQAWLAGLLALATGLAAAHGGDWIAALAGGLLTALLLYRMAAGPVAAASAPVGDGHVALIEQVVPVWHRQIVAARSHAEESTGSILQAFSSIDERLEQAVRLAEQSSMDLSGANVDALIDNNDAVLANLLEPVRAAIGQRDEALNEIERVAEAIDELRQGAARVRQLARRINMVAINASVESARAGSRAGSFAVLAEEVRTLAQQSTQDASRMLNQSNQLDERLRSLRVQAATRDSSDEELRAQADASARRAIGGLLDSVGQVSRSSRGLREAGAEVRAEVERVLMGFQAQDRFNQMLGNICEDMERLQHWLHQEGDLSANQAAVWLERLEASYTMEAQRTQHHGQRQIEREAQVEFF